MIAIHPPSLVQRPRATVTVTLVSTCTTCGGSCVVLTADKQIDACHECVRRAETQWRIARDIRHNAA